MRHGHQLRNVPPTLFSSIIGAGGLGLAWQQAGLYAGSVGLSGAAMTVVADGLLITAALAFVAFFALYALKLIIHRDAVLEDALHPAQANFLAAIPIGAMIVTQGLAVHGPTLAGHLWLTAALGQILVSLYTVIRWISQDQDVQQLNPSWFIPVAGNLVAPAGAVMAGIPELGWFFFSVGVTFWLVLFAITFYRILFHDPLPIASCPTLAILIAPPALAFVAYTALKDGLINDVSRIFLYVAAFLAAVVLGMAHRFWRLPFSLSWWAYTFPLATLTSAFFIFARATGFGIVPWIAVASLTLATLVVGLTAGLTVRAALAGTLFEPAMEMEETHAA